MPQLIFKVDIDSDDKESDLKYLRKLEDVFYEIVFLASWGYTDDEKLASSEINPGKE